LSDVQHYAAVNDPTHPLAASQFTENVAHSFNDTRGTGAMACDTGSAYVEQALDVEAVHAMAPGAHILYVGAKNCNAPLYQALRKVVDHHLANIVTASWGDDAGDRLDDADLRASVDATLMMAAGTGVSVMFSSADDGDGYSDTGVIAPDYPASSPWATAVGGTTLEAGFGVRQLGWSTALSSLCTQPTDLIAGCSPALVGTWLPPVYAGGSGGGTSYHYPEPSYQAGVVPLALATRNAASVGSTPMRVEPDVAMDGDTNTGLRIGLTETFPGGAKRYGQLRGGGTSLASPLFAGIVALADQLAGTSLGFLNPALYQLHRSHPGVIDDVVPGSQAQRLVRYGDGVDTAAGLQFLTSIVDYQGTDACPGGGSCVAPSVSLSTAPGFDDMTGLGTPTVGFVPALARL
jgi:subtilase family serine protease